MRYIKLYEDLIKSEYVNWNTIDLYKIFDEINKLIFNNELQKIEICKVKSKKFGARFLYTEDRKTKKEEATKIEVSTLHKKKIQDLKNVLAHEMIHYKLLNVRQENKHGYDFTKEMNRINKEFTEYNITILDDSEFDNLPDLKEEMYYVVLTDKNGISIIVIKNDIKDIILNALTYTAQRKSLTEHNVTLNLYKTKLGMIKNWKIHGSIKAIKGFYPVPDNKYDILMAGSELVDKRTYKDGKKVD